MLNAHDLKTETFSNRDGWTAIRVTHLPSNISVERTRTDELRSAVQAQKECVDELRGLVAMDELRGLVAVDELRGLDADDRDSRPRGDLATRVTELERRVAELTRRLDELDPRPEL